MKLCKRCNKSKPLDRFRVNKSRKGILYHRSPCRDCENAYSRNFKKENPEHRKRISQKSRFRSQYKVSLAYIDELKIQQGNQCAICNKEEDIIQQGSKRELSIDHCHATGIVRGLLCQNCNAGLAHFKDMEELLQVAINYLRYSPANQRYTDKTYEAQLNPFKSDE